MCNLTIHGHLSLGQRLELPACLIGAIRKKYPAKDNQYRGFFALVNEEIYFEN
jgi:hypothetical protein